jgi:hypothetical protein
LVEEPEVEAVDPRAFHNDTCASLCSDHQTLLAHCPAGKLWRDAIDPNAAATAELVVRVTRADDDAPYPRVLVQVAGVRRWTDANGEARVELPEGEYWLRLTEIVGVGGLQCVELGGGVREVEVSMLRSWDPPSQRRCLCDVDHPHRHQTDYPTIRPYPQDGYQEPMPSPPAPRR